MEYLLMIPGPVMLSERVLKAMSRQMIPHRGEEFKQLFSECLEILKDVFRTDNDVLILNGSGTCGMEAAIAGLVGKNDKMLAVSNGKFGERFAEIGRIYGNVVELKFEWGKPIDLERVEDALSGDGFKVVSFVHNETSTGMLNPAREIASIAKDHGALVVMDGITSIGGDDVRVDEWGIDIAIVGSQKCLGAPPGLCAVSVSDDAWNAMKDGAYYHDLKKYRKSAQSRETPYTPSIPLFFALHEALMMIREEGMENRIKRHRKLSRAVREGVTSIGLELFPQPDEHSSYSNTVTAIKTPPGMGDEIRKKMRENGVIVAGGQEHLKGKIFRIASMGNIGRDEILRTLEALERAVGREGCVEAARKVL